MNLKKMNRMLFWFSLKHIPLLFFCGPKIIVCNEKTLQVKIKLNWLTKNHLNSMYFGTLSIGADISAGFGAFYLINQKKYKINIIFKDFSASFLKRAHENVVFVCNQLKDIENLIEKANKSAERQHLPVKITAYEQSEINHNPVATFSLTLSVKKKN